jgi:hypothetical protein
VVFFFLFYIVISIIFYRLLDLDHPEVTDLVTAQLVGIRKALKKMTFKGAQVLMQKLDAVNGEFKL